MMRFVLLEKSRERDDSVYQEAIRQLCEPGKSCYLLFWTDKRFLPVALPMSDPQAAAEVASYTKNTNTNFEQFLWSCHINSNGGFKSEAQQVDDDV